MKKNIRKVLALLAAVAMMLTVLPLGTLVASADSANFIVNEDFESGVLGDDWILTTEGGSMVSDEAAKDGEYGFLMSDEGYKGILTSMGFAVEEGVTYTLSFDVKALRKGTQMNYQVKNPKDPAKPGNGNNFDGNKLNQVDNMTGEWQHIEYSFTKTTEPNDYASILIVSLGYDFYVDNIAVTKDEGGEPEVPAGPFVDTFEDGNADGWKVSGDGGTGITDEDAANGSYAFVVQGTANEDYNNTAESPTVPVQAGKTYIVSYQAKYLPGTASGSAIAINMTNYGDANRGSKLEGLLDTTWPRLSDSWKEYSHEVTPSKDGFLSMMFINCNANYYIDDFKVSEAGAEEPVFGFVNGDFETGDITGWETWQNSVISEEASYNGEYGANLIGDGGWGGMLDQTITGLTVGNEYKLSFMLKVNNNGVNVQVKLNPSDKNSIEGCGGWYDKNKAGEWTKIEYTFVAPAESIFVNFCGAGNKIAEDAYVDDFVIVDTAAGDEPGDPADKNLIVDGGFESGNGDAWSVAAPSTITNDPEYVKEGQYALILEHTAQWGCGAKQTGFKVEKNTDYVISFWNMRLDNSSAAWNLYVKSGNANVPLTSGQYWFNQNHNDWVHQVLEFNTGDYEVIDLYFQMEGSVTSFAVDEVVFMKKSDIPNEDGDNLVKNGSFEKGTESWDVKKDTCVLETTDAHTGTNSMVLEANDAQWSECVMQKVKLQKDTVYVLVWWSKRVEGDGPWCLWAMDWKNLCDLDKSTGTIISGEYTFGHTNANWTEQRIEFNSGEIEELMLKFGPDSTSPGIMLVDDIGLYVKGTEPEISEPEVPVIPMTMLSFGTVNNRPMTADKNLLTNGSFESAEGLDDFLCDTVQIVDDSTAPSGSKSLYFNTSGVEDTQKHVIYVDVEPETDYVFSAWLKGAFISDDNRYDATIGIVNPDNNKYLTFSEFLFSTNKRQLVPTAWDNEWHLRSIVFNSGSSTKVGIALSGSYSQMWVDDIALFKNGDGKKFVSENMAGNVSVDFDNVEFNGADDQDNLIADPTFSTGSLDFWKDGSGFGLGMIDIAKNEYEYGNSLKYTASKNPVGYYYINWLDVEPNTDYTFSVDVKILESGEGKLALMDGKIRHNINFIEISFSKEDYGDEWFTLVFNLNTNVYDTLGIGICDLGGSALIDNMRLFKTEDGKEVVDDYIEPPVEDGWIKDGSKWTYYENGKQVKAKWIKDGSWYYIDANGYMVADKWVKDSTGWCYLSSNGAMVTNKWVKDSVGWCYVGADGYAVTNTWKKDSVGWCYLNGSGSMVKNAWVKDNGKWYFLDANGYMVTNAWKKDCKGWVYVGSDGAMLTNAWCKDSKGWCYVGADGYAVTNCWKKDSHGWIWLNASGSMTKNAWVKDNDKWYYLDGEGYMVTNAWKKDSKGWVYVGSDGAMLTNAWCKDSKGWCYVGSDGYAVTNCWKKDSKGWIWLDENGSMKKNAWVSDKGNWYYVDGEGYMVYNTSVTIGSKKHNFNASGVCTNP